MLSATTSNWIWVYALFSLSSWVWLPLCSSGSSIPWDTYLVSQSVSFRQQHAHAQVQELFHLRGNTRSPTALWAGRKISPRGTAVTREPRICTLFRLPQGPRTSPPTSSTQTPILSRFWRRKLREQYRTRWWSVVHCTSSTYSQSDFSSTLSTFRNVIVSKYARHLQPVDLSKSMSPSVLAKSRYFFAKCTPARRPMTSQWMQTFVLNKPIRRRRGRSPHIVNGQPVRLKSRAGMVRS